jgi:hypothetical protein
MMEFHTIWLIVTHYGYDAIVELVVDLGDHFITHYVVYCVVVGKTGVVFAYKVVKRTRTRKPQVNLEG